MAKTVELFYDFSSPNAYFTAFQLPPLVDRYSGRLLLRPFFLGGLFKTLGVHMTPGMSSPVKATHSKLDFERWADKFQIPFRFPSRFPMTTTRALRAALDVEQTGGDALSLSQAVFKAYWVDDRDISDPAVLRELFASLGLDAEALLARTEQVEAKDALRRATDKAIERGVFGAPHIFVEGEPFFGKDRLDFVEDALRR
jgi:2-hydroxychromene-2-carboxylate isomerase